MTREQLEHLIRAAGAIVGDDAVLVIGSQAILGSFSEEVLPDIATVSYEADIAFFEDASGDKSDLLDGSIGEESLFHQTFGIYAQGVSVQTAVLPRGWQDRLVPVLTPNTRGVTGFCLEVHDLCIAKLAAGRPHDLAFCRALINAGLADRNVLRERIGLAELSTAKQEFVEEVLRQAG